ncbi:hypothetical protein EDB80DRAFT_693476 [Ilyonectria destructans]|nr:hypothetical protein EDB80DRAFT_693476 [Ilyonectria destructans]
MSLEVNAIIEPCEQMDLPIHPPRSRFFQDLFPQAEMNDGNGRNDKRKNSMLEIESSDDDQETRIGILEMQLDSHKRAMAEILTGRMNQLYERDCTIKTPRFHIVALDQSVQELEKENLRLNNHVSDLRNQLEAFTIRDWQSSSGTRKKRKLDE